MRNILYIIAFIVVTCGCCSKTNGQQYSKQLQLYKDSINTCIDNYQAFDDSMEIVKAIKYCNVLLGWKLTDTDRYNVLQNKIQLLGLQSLFKEAFTLQEQAVQLLDSNNINRLEYYAIKYKLSGNKGLSCFYFKRAIEECDKNIGTAAYVCKKAEILLAMGKDKEAKAALKEYLKKHSDIKIKFMLQNLDELKEFQRWECLLK